MRMRPIRLPAATALVLTAVSGQLIAQTYPPDIPEAEVRVYRSVDSVDLNVWILYPHDRQSPGDAPAMIFFFGGGFVGGSPRQFLPQARALASRGMVAILADYRVANRHGTGPSDAVRDAKAAVRWVRTHAAELGVDPGRIGASGGSSGGQLAASAATLPGFDDPPDDGSVSSRPDAVVLFNPAVVIAPVEGIPEVPDWVAERHDAPLMDLSPYHHLAIDPVPTLILHGSDDELFDPATVHAYCARAVALGGRCEAVVYDGGTHGFFNRSPYREQTIARMEQFLESIKWLTPRTEIGR